MYPDLQTVYGTTFNIGSTKPKQIAYMAIQNGYPTILNFK